MSERDNKDLKRIAAFRKELKSDPSSLVFVALAETLNRLGRFDEAVEVADSGIRRHVDSVGGRLALAVARAGQDDVKAALEQIKAALTIDEENPRALALMGSLLLDKGLAHRAVQFLHQAVRLAPDRSEYQDLLRRAKRLAKGRSEVQLPKLTMNEDSSAENPWSDRAEIPSSNRSRDALYEELGTEFDSGREMFETDSSSTVDQAEISDLLGDSKRVAVESTQYASIEDMLGESLVSDLAPASASEQSETSSEARMGGSAAEHSSPLTQGVIPEPIDDSELRTKAVSQSKPERTSTPKTPSRPLSPEKMVRPAMEAPSVRREKAVAELKKEDEPLPYIQKSPGTPKEPKARKLTPLANEKAKAQTSEFEEPVPSSAQSREAPASDEEQRPATMFVDDAVWAIYGAERPDAPSESASPSADVEKIKKSKKADKSVQKTPPGSSDRRRSVLVVRTSKYFGRVIGGLLFLLLFGFALGLGLRLSKSSSNTSSNKVAEDIRGIVADIERGSLSSLRNSLDLVADLIDSDPQTQSSLRGVKAEIHSLLWARFGQAASERQQALAELKLREDESPSLEVIHARLLLNESKLNLREIKEVLDQKEEDSPQSIKVLLLQARAESFTNPQRSLPYLMKAYRLAPENRNVLLSLARWNGSQKKYRMMIHYLESILKQDEYRDDIEALLDYLVIAYMLNDDTLISRMQSRLVGVVRDEGTVVAHDELGRASLVFAAMNLLAQDQTQASDNLSGSEVVYSSSPGFKKAVGMALQLIGEFDRSAKQFQQLLKLKPNSKDALMGLARVEYAKILGFDSNNTRKIRKGRRVAHEGHTRFGVVRLRIGLFAKVDVEMNAAVFPEERYRALAQAYSGEELRSELRYTNLVHAGRAMLGQGQLVAATKNFKKALQVAEKPEAFSALGTVLFLRKEYSASLSAFESALKMNDSLTEAVLGKARILVHQGKPLPALALLELVLNDEQIVPEATLLAAQLQAQRGDDRGELELLKSLVQTLPESPDLWIRIGRASHANGELNSALEAYRRALTLKSRLRAKPLSKKRRKKEKRTAVDFLYLGRLLTGDSVVRAKQMFLASVALEGTPNESHYFLGKLLMKKGASRRAGKRSLKLYLRKDPKGDYAEDVRKLIRRK